MTLFNLPYLPLVLENTRVGHMYFFLMHHNIDIAIEFTFITSEYKIQVLWNAIGENILFLIYFI